LHFQQIILHTFLKGLGGSAAIPASGHRLLAFATACTVAIAIAAHAAAFAGVPW
jgi:hypothetical protein